jgi:hypothetical protein
MLIGWKESIETTVCISWVSHPTSTCMHITHKTMFVQINIYLSDGASDLDNMKTNTEK